MADQPADHHAARLTWGIRKAMSSHSIARSYALVS